MLRGHVALAGARVPGAEVWDELIGHRSQTAREVRGPVVTSLRHSTMRRASCWALVALVLAMPAWVSAQTIEVHGLIVGRVYEIDSDKYREYRERLEKEGQDPDKPELLDPEEYLAGLPGVIVTARGLPTNLQFSSEFSDGEGEYLIRDSTAAAYTFTLVHEEVEYSVSQNLDLNVELSYVAELCFVVDREQKQAWMISEGMRRDPEAPPFVPERCQSRLSACLAMLTGDDEGFPAGLLLLLAGSGAAATTIGIISTDQTEASPPSPPF